MRHETWRIARWPTTVMLLALAALLQAQDFQIRTRVDLVVVPVTVKGDHNRLVTGLTQNDFTILEDGKKQTVTNFSIEPVPISAVVLVDTGLSATSFNQVKDSIPALAGAFAESDEVAVYRYDNQVEKLQDFTSDLPLIETVLNTLKDIQASATKMISGPFFFPGPVINGMPASGIQTGIPTMFRVPAPDTALLSDAFFAAAEELSKRDDDRRKIILAVSTGRNERTQHSHQETLDRLLDRGIQVYGIGMDQALLSRKMSTLDGFAKNTGGDTCFVSSQAGLEDCYSESTVQARNQYVLGYISTQRAPRTGPVFRTLDVRARGGMETRHRKGYFQFP